MLSLEKSVPSFTLINCKQKINMRLKNLRRNAKHYSFKEIGKKTGIGAGDAEFHIGLSLSFRFTDTEFSITVPAIPVKTLLGLPRKRLKR